MALERRDRIRLAVLALLLAALYLVGKATGVVDRLDAAAVQGLVQEAGAWGMLAFIAVFVLGELIHLPGILFVGTGALLWGPVVGPFVSLAGAVASVSITFWLVRCIGGTPIRELRRPFLRRMLSRLESRPVTTVLVLRLIVWVSPPLNYALALTSIRFRDFLLGSVLGLAPPVFVITWVLGLVTG